MRETLWSAFARPSIEWDGRTFYPFCGVRRGNGNGSGYFKNKKLNTQWVSSFYFITFLATNLMAVTRAFVNGRDEEIRKDKYPVRAVVPGAHFHLKANVDGALENQHRDFHANTRSGQDTTTLLNTHFLFTAADFHNLSMQCSTTRNMLCLHALHQWAPFIP